jgi:hypothetical protein
MPRERRCWGALQDCMYCTSSCKVSRFFSLKLFHFFVHYDEKNLLTSDQNPCLLNIMIPEALEKAESLDRQHENNAPKGVLHGLPISLKDQFHVKGSDTTMGYVGWIGTFEGDAKSERVGRVDSEIVAQLESMGAVVFCKVWIYFFAGFMTAAVNSFTAWMGHYRVGSLKMDWCAVCLVSNEAQAAVDPLNSLWQFVNRWSRQVYHKHCW